MAAYNGERYIEEQIRSILSQQEVSVTLLIVDDCSTDSTPSICQQLAHDCKNVIFARNDENLGSGATFMSSLYAIGGHCQYDYVAFADQDDYWLPGKLVRAVDSIAGYGSTPCLYYSDVVDVNGSLEGGYRESEHMISHTHNLDTLLMYNWAPGCTMVVNRKMCDLLQRYVPGGFPRYHDAWIHLVAMTCGVVVSNLGESFILRRLTGENQVGDRGFGQVSITRIVHHARHALAAPNRPFTKVAGWLLEGYDESMNADARHTVRRFVKLNSSVIGRVEYALFGGYCLPSRFEMAVLRAKILMGRI